MVVYETKRFPRRINIMDTEMHYLSLFLSVSKRGCKGGVDSTTKGSETGMPVSTIAFCSSNGCSRHVHDSNMLARHAPRFANTKFSSGYPIAAVRRCHYFFIEGSVEEARNLSTLLDLFMDFSGLQINRAKINFGEFQSNP